MRLFRLYLLSSEQTQFGTAVAWITLEPTGLRQVTLQPDQFPASVKYEEYWNRLESLSHMADFRLNWGEVLTGKDFPMSDEEARSGWDRVKLGVSVQEAEASVQELLEEAVSLKQWTIPPHALV